jgi:hypothetical protein
MTLLSFIFHCFFVVLLLTAKFELFGGVDSDRHRGRA